jgi:hypothetical protein
VTLVRERVAMIAITAGVLGSVAAAAADVAWAAVACGWLAVGGWIVGDR